MRPSQRFAPGYSAERVALLDEGGGRFVRGVRFRRPRVPPALFAAPARRRLKRGIRKLAGSIATVSAEQRLLQRATMGFNLLELARLEELGYEGWLERQLDHRAIDDSELEEVLARALPSLAMSPADVYERYQNNPGGPIVELVLASLYRALYSPRQLFERMVVFWSDHFNIDLFSGLQFLLKPTDDREVIRRHALGSFPDLLRASAHSPAMLVYLTNESNDKDHPNENYARELLELHTMGADKGYTQRDVQEVARCFTGWTVAGRAAGDRLGRFFFDDSRHDNGEKRVLGRTIPAGGGAEDGERVLDILAGHSGTSRFIARKLLVYMWGYKPKKSLVKEVAAKYRSTDGDIKAMLSLILERRRMAAVEPKLKRPFHLEVSALRALFAELRNARFTLDQLVAAGHLPFNWAPPNGYPDSRAYWSGLILPRWNFAAELARRKRSGVKLDLPFLDSGKGVGRIVEEIDLYLLNGTMSDQTRAAVTEFLASAERTRKRILDAVGLVVSSPEFQEY